MRFYVPGHGLVQTGGEQATTDAVEQHSERMWHDSPAFRARWNAHVECAAGTELLAVDRPVVDVADFLALRAAQQRGGGDPRP